MRESRRRAEDHSDQHQRYMQRLTDERENIRLGSLRPNHSQRHNSTLSNDSDDYSVNDESPLLVPTSGHPAPHGHHDDDYNQNHSADIGYHANHNDDEDGDDDYNDEECNDDNDDYDNNDNGYYDDGYDDEDHNDGDYDDDDRSYYCN